MKRKSQSKLIPNLSLGNASADVPSKRGLLLLPKSFEMKLTSSPITARTRKLRVRWTVDDPACPPDEITQEQGVVFYVWR